MNLFKTTWMRLNSIRFIDSKIKLNFNKIKMLRLCSNFSLMMNYRKNLKYCIINMKIDKACHAINDIIKKNCFLNKIWLKFCQDDSKFNFVLTILKTYKNKTILIISHFTEMLMCVKWINCYFIVFLMLVISRFVISFRKLFSVWYFYII